jgi:hypothetical protein
MEKGVRRVVLGTGLVATVAFGLAATAGLLYLATKIVKLAWGG